MVRQRGPGRPTRFQKRFNFALTQDMHDGIHAVAELSNDDAAEAVRRMIERQLPFFLYFASVNKRLPSAADEAER